MKSLILLISLFFIKTASANSYADPEIWLQLTGKILKNEAKTSEAKINKEKMAEIDSDSKNPEKDSNLKK